MWGIKINIMEKFENIFFLFEMTKFTLMKFSFRNMRSDTDSIRSVIEFTNIYHMTVKWSHSSKQVELQNGKHFIIITMITWGACILRYTELANLLNLQIYILIPWNLEECMHIHCIRLWAVNYIGLWNNINLIHI